MLTYAAIAAVLTGIAVFVVSFFAAQRGQKAIYYAVRRHALDQANNRYKFSFWCVLLAAGLFVASFLVPGAPAATAGLEIATAAPLTAIVISPVAPTTAPATSAPVLAPTPTVLVDGPTPTATVAIAPTTAPVIISSTQTTNPAPAAAANAPSQQLALRAVGTGWDNANNLQGVANEFAVGTPSIYVFFNFADIPRNTLIRHVWLKDGKTQSFSSATFTKQGSGTDAVFWSPKDGFQAGLYEVRVLLGNTQQFVANFLVR